MTAKAGADQQSNKHMTDKLAKARATGNICSPGCDVDAGQHDLGAAIIDQLSGRLDNLVARHRPIVSTAIGDYAEGTAMITSLLDLQESPCVTMEAVNHVRCRLSQAHHITNHDFTAIFASAKRLPLIRLQLLVIAYNMINFGHVCPALRSDLGRASGHDNSCIRIFPARAADSLSRLPLRLGGDGAGVEDIALFACICRLIAHMF